MPDPPHDDDARRELAELRRRAYGRDADIGSDPRALARLDALEAGERRRAPAHAPAEEPLIAGDRGGGPWTDGVDASLPPEEPCDASPSGPPTARRRPPRWQSGLIAGVAAAGALLGLAAGGTALAERTPPVASGSAELAVAAERVAGFTGNSTTRALSRIPVDGLFGRYVQLPNYASAPEFPTKSPLVWVQPMGDYFAAHVWLARPESGESCLLVVIRDVRHGACVPPDVFEASVLLILVPYAELDPDDLPPSMTPNQSLGFWWRPGRPLDVLVGPSGGGSADD